MTTSSTKEPPPQDPLTNYVIKYSDLKTTKVIGSGGTGQVAIGILISKNMKVAIKTLYSVDMSEKNEKLYNREVECLANLKHPFLLPFVGYTTKKPFCIVTKYIPNGSLFDAIHGDELGLDLTPTDLTIIAYGIASGMLYLHDKDIIHRDLKPQNVLLDEKKLPVICDFGSSRKVVQQTMTGLCGTPNYMAPEFIRNEHYGTSVDIYSYGLVIWEMITQQIPYYGMDPAQVICAILMNQPLEMPDEAPEIIINMIQACINPEPSKRPTFKQIIAKFESGEIYFTGCEINNFLQAIQPYTQLRRRSSSQKLIQASKSETKEGIILLSKPKFPLIHPGRLSIVSHINQLANAYLGSFSNGNEQQINTSIDFFEAHIDDPIMVTIDIWPKLLPILAEPPPEHAKKLKALSIHCAENHQILARIAEIEFLHKYITEHTLHLFLYVINFVTQLINMKMVKAIFKICNTDRSEKAIILLCRILAIVIPASAIPNQILRFFTENVQTFANKRGGHLMLRTLVNCGSTNLDIVSSYATSTINLNLIAAYESAFTLNAPPSIFQLQNVLKHVVSDDAQLRDAALAFLRKYAANTSGDPRSLIIEALITAVLRYSSELAVLLLCRIASDSESSTVLTSPGISELWLQISPQKAVVLLKVFLVVFTQEKNEKYLRSIPDTMKFMSGVLQCGDTQSFLSICWLISKITITEEYASHLDEAGVIENICRRFDKETKPKSLIYISHAIAPIIKIHYSPAYIETIRPLCALISSMNQEAEMCIMLLSLLSCHHQTHQELLNANVIATLHYYKEVEGKTQAYIKKINLNLKASGSIP